VRGGQKAQPFDRPLDRRVRALVAEAHRGRMLNGSLPMHTTNRGGMEACEARSAFAVPGSLKAHGVGANRRATRSRKANFLTIQLREAQAIDRLNKVREAQFTE
jgi:hypothetical protein